MLFEVRVAGAAQQLSTLHIEAANAADARRQALRMRLTPVSVRPHRASRAGSGRGFDRVLFAEELQMLLGAGLPLVEAIDGLAERHADIGSRSVLAALSAALRQGERLSGALARQPQVFPPLFVGIVRAAERTSSLAASLAKYVAYESHLRVLRERLTSAAIYPAILLVAGTGVTLFLLTYVVPRFAAVYDSSGRALPAASQGLLMLGRWMGDNGLAVVLGIAVALVLGGLALRRRWQQLGWLQLLALLPGVAAHVATIEVARLYRTLSMLVEGGLPVREALVLSDAVVAPARQPALAEVRRRVEGGHALSEGLREAGLGTPLALRLLQVGERSGQLGAMLERAALFHEHETAVWIDRFSKTFGPALMILISLVVGVVVVLLYIPVFELAGSLQ